MEWEKKHTILPSPVQWKCVFTDGSQKPQTAAISLLAEFCRQLQNKLYERVLPDFYSPITNYRVRDIETDINDFVDDEQEKQRLLEDWTRLRESLGWDDKLVRTMQLLQQSSRSRSLLADRCGSDLNVEIVKTLALELHEKGLLKGHVKLENFVRLLEMWKKLV